MAQSQMFNISPRALGTSRYQMPGLELKFEKRKTIITNLENLAKSLHRNPNILLTHFSQSLGCGTVKKNGLNGHHCLHELRMTLYKFIETFVLCKVCDNPETEFRCKNKHAVKMVCKACGHLEIFDKSDHKLVGTLVRSV